ncbi:MAG: hypothetical protein PHT27_05820 [Candidatus Izemoplasmatales bacterium]|nr:hypothetical protein [Candidatus Izemoplasmatales bacterium]
MRGDASTGASTQCAEDVQGAGSKGTVLLPVATTGSEADRTATAGRSAGERDWVRFSSVGVNRFSFSPLMRAVLSLLGNKNSKLIDRR